jgi:hypothetical protein
MNAKIFSNAYGHFLKSTFPLIILGQDNGKAVQSHLGGLRDGSMKAIWQVSMKQSGHMFLKFELGIPSGEEKRPFE